MSKKSLHDIALQRLINQHLDGPDLTIATNTRISRGQHLKIEKESIAAAEEQYPRFVGQ